jgi:cytochrome P450 family 110
MPGLPPGPRSPSFLQSARYLTRPLEFFQEQVDTYGPTFTIHLAGLPTLVMLTSPPDLKALFTAPADRMHAGSANSKAFGPVVGTRTHFVLDEESHLERRRLMLPPFHGDRMHEYGEAMGEVTARAVAAWPRDRAFAAHPELQRITLQVILRTVFGLDEATPRDEQVIQQLVRLANEAVASPLLMARPLQWDLGPWSPWGRVVRVIRESDRVLLAEIRRRREAGDAGERKDILSMLLVARNERGEGLTDAEVRDELATIVLAGHETTGTSLAWALECLLPRPEVVRRIRDEMSRVAGPGQVPRGSEQLAKLEYLDAAVKEVLRFRPIMAFGGTRIAQQPWKLHEWVIPAGAAVANALSMVHRRSDLYPEPHEFRPERFLGKRPDPYEWTPFGGGVRRCLGMAFALYEMKIVLARLLSTTDLELADTVPIHPVTRGFFIAPARGLPIRVRDRQAETTMVSAAV